MKEDWDDEGMSTMNMGVLELILESVMNGASVEEGLAAAMQDMECMSNEDCEGDIRAKDLLSEFVDTSDPEAFSCGWIDMDQMGDQTSTTDFCMPTMLCGQDM